MIRAELFRRAGAREHTAAALGVEATCEAPVLALCRKLVAAGHDPAESVEAWRGEVLSLRVRTIGAGAGLMVEERREGNGPRFVRYRAPSWERGAAVRGMGS